MGYTTVYGTKGVSKKAFMDAELSGTNHMVVDSAMVGREYYAAVYSSKTDTTFGVVCLVTRENGEITYKDMDETMGPYFFRCPARILDRLSPTTNANALKWRASCRAELAARKATPKIEHGTIIRFAVPIRFTTGETLDTFRVVKNGAKVRFANVDNSYAMYRITHWRARSFTIVG